MFDMKYVARRTKRARALGGGETADQRVVELALQGKLAKSARAAVRHHKAQGNPVTFKRGDKIIRETSDGRKEQIGTVKRAVDFRLPKGVRVLGK